MMRVVVMVSTSVSRWLVDIHFLLVASRICPDPAGRQRLPSRAAFPTYGGCELGKHKNWETQKREMGDLRETPAQRKWSGFGSGSAGPDKDVRPSSMSACRPADLV